LQFPKKGAGDVSATVNGVPATIRIGNASAYAKSGEIETNGYLIRERNSNDFAEFGPGRPDDLLGGAYWISFAAGFNPFEFDGNLEFEFIDETCPTPNPLREPRNPKAEAARLAGFKNWAATKAGGILAPKARPYDSTDPYFEAKVGADWDSAIIENYARIEAAVIAEIEAAEAAEEAKIAAEAIEAYRRAKAATTLADGTDDGLTPEIRKDLADAESEISAIEATGVTIGEILADPDREAKYGKRRK
jgi:hypothetical protein